jgi:hypothetical protein
MMCLGTFRTAGQTNPYESDTVTEVKEFAGPHLLPAWPGWEQVADYALDWALRHARQSSPE